MTEFDDPSRTSSLHPSPQFRRAEWTDLCGTWDFAFDDADQGLDEHWHAPGSEAFTRTIRVPYPPESKLSEVHDTAYHPVVWYRRAFPAPQLPPGERLILHFGAVDYRASVWLDGRHVGEHEGGHTPFACDITTALDRGSDAHTLVVRAEDRPLDLSQPRGKQTSKPEPQAVFYDRTTGIWQPVWLETVPAVHLTDLAWTPHLDRKSVELEARLSRVPDTPQTLDVTLHQDGEVLARQSVRVPGDSDTARMTVEIPELVSSPGKVLWSPESPNLVDADVTLGDDTVFSYLGLRSAGFRDGFFQLNDKPYYLRLVLEQGFWPESHLAAPGAEALRREVELVKELGFNGVRVHQKAEDPRFLYWCDRLGLLVWGEMANSFEFSRRAVTRLVREWQEVVERDRSHPCVVAWVPMNESWGVPDLLGSAQQRSYITALYHLTKALDPTRPVLSNEGWEHTVSDIWGVHDYSPSGADLTRRYGTPEAVERTVFGAGPGRRKVLLEDTERTGQPVVITEFGGLSYLPARGKKWFGYGTVDTLEDLLAGFRELVTAILDSTEVTGFCYTQLTDTQQEENGLVTADRTAKLPVEAVREIVARPSRALPTEAVDAFRRAAREASGGASA